MRNAAKAQGISVEGYVLSLIAESVDSTGLAESYWEASQNLMEQARGELVKGNLRQAGKRLGVLWHLH